DPTHGFINYRSKADAKDLGLTSISGSDVYIGVDSTTVPARGRSSVRIESQESYQYGLFIAKFTHLPKTVCGAWPAFWMTGSNWPIDGELDIYEEWNLASRNRITAHTGTSSQVGSCKIDTSTYPSTITPNCDNNTPGHINEGCSVPETNGLWGAATGGTYATEWQADRLQVWSWAAGAEPTDVKNGNPDPILWGKPNFALKSGSCDVKKAFTDMKLVLNIDFCGDAAGQDVLWSQGCKAATKVNTCADYVKNNPAAFKDVYWKIAYINVYQ
ncbi:concanavalin A-like lectin/glucanase domain-containing protein, partial [Bombardia bombarda]